MSNRPLTGGYGVVDIPGWFGWNIRHFTHSRFDHAFVILDADAGTILEARPGGARISNLSEYAGLPMLFSDDAISRPFVSEKWKLHPSPHQLTNMAEQRYVSVGYGYLDIVLLGLEVTFRYTPRWLDRYVLDEHRMICSQLVADFGRRYLMDWNCGQSSPQFVTPGLLARRIK